MDQPSGCPDGDIGIMTIPVPSKGIVNVRKSPVTGSLRRIPSGFKFGRPGNAPANVATLSTPVRIVNGCPDCASVDPEISQPPKTWPRDSLAHPEPNHGTSYK